MARNINEAINILLNYRSDLVPEAYWVVNGRFVIKTAYDGEVGTNYYLIDGSKVIGTNPMRIDLDPREMKRITR